MRVTAWPSDGISRMSSHPPGSASRVSRSKPPHPVSSVYVRSPSPPGALSRTTWTPANCRWSRAVSRAVSRLQSTRAVCAHIVSQSTPDRKVTLPADAPDAPAPVDTDVLTYPFGTSLSYGESSR